MNGVYKYRIPRLHTKLIRRCAIATRILNRRPEQLIDQSVQCWGKLNHHAPTGAQWRRRTAGAVNRSKQLANRAGLIKTGQAQRSSSTIDY